VNTRISPLPRALIVICALTPIGLAAQEHIHLRAWAFSAVRIGDSTRGKGLVAIARIGAEYEIPRTNFESHCRSTGKTLPQVLPAGERFNWALTLPIAAPQISVMRFGVDGAGCG
jgi:hypothetical protein